MTTPQARTSRGERGSIPMALLAILAIASITTVLTATMVAGQRQTAFDRNYERSLQTAEAGLDRMLSQIESLEVTNTFSLPATTIDGYTVTGDATRDVDTGDWTLVATSTAPDGTSRSIEVFAENIPIFQFAAFGKIVSDFNGDNGADSYRSGEYDLATDIWTSYPYSSYLDSNNNVIPPNGDTGKGTVGTNGRLYIKGVAFDETDGAEIHFAKEVIPDPLEGATGYCDGVTSTCNAYLPKNTGKLKYFKRPIDLGIDNPPSAPTGHFDGENKTLAAGEEYVFTSAKLYESTVFEGTPDNPTIIWLTGQLTVDNHEHINFENVGGRLRPKPSPGLIILSVSEGVAMNFATHVQISALILAPNGAFAGGSQGHIWGSLQVGGIDNTGGWKFHYDEAAADIPELKRPIVQDWVEQ